MIQKDPAIWLNNLFLKGGLSYNMASILSTTAFVFIVLFLSWLWNFIARIIIRTIGIRVVRRTTSVRDDIFPEQKVFTRHSHFAPVLVRYRGLNGHGIPVYGFATNTDFITYENKVSEVFEHLFVIMKEFELKAFQLPAGDDVLSAARNKLNS